MHEVLPAGAELVQNRHERQILGKPFTSGDDLSCGIDAMAELCEAMPGLAKGQCGALSWSKGVVWACLQKTRLRTLVHCDGQARGGWTHPFALMS